jgi:hypothetical protein
MATTTTTTATGREAPMTMTTMTTTMLASSSLSFGTNIVLDHLSPNDAVNIDGMTIVDDATMERIGGECDDCRDEDGTDEDGVVDDSDATTLAILLDYDAANAPADYDYDDDDDDDELEEGGAIDARKKRGKTPRKRRRKNGGRGRWGRRKRAGIDVGVGRRGGGSTATMETTTSEGPWRRLVAGRLASFPARYVPPLVAMVASIIVVFAISTTSVGRVHGIVRDGGYGGGGIADTMGGTRANDVDAMGDGGGRSIDADSDDGSPHPPPSDDWKMDIRYHGADDDDDDDTIIEDSYSWSRILQEGTPSKSSSSTTTTPIDVPAPAPASASPGAWAPGDVLIKDATMMPSGGLGFRPESDSLFDASISLGQVCVSDPERCGCPDVYQTDYRGSINTTRAGQPCLRWDDENLIWAQELLFGVGWNNSEYPEEQIESNFCRNRNNDPDGTWCFVGINGYPTSIMSLTLILNYCNVPVCDMLTPTTSPTDSAIPTSSSEPTMTTSPSDIPSSSASPTPGPSTSSLPTITSSPTQQCSAADKSTCGCEVAQWTDYRGTINKTATGVTCQRWDSNIFGLEYIQKNPDAGLDENYCRSPGSMVPFCIASLEEYGILDMLECDVPKCDPCSCMPPCGETNVEKCGCPSALQAEACCEVDESKCKCNYLKKACHTSLENNSTDFCEEAQVECCKDNDAACKCGYWKEACNIGMKDVYYGGDANNVSTANLIPCIHANNECCMNSADPTCECSMYDDICSVYQSESTCHWAGNRCCFFDTQLFDMSDVVTNMLQCNCDFYTYSENVYGFKSENKSNYCLKSTLGETNDGFVPSFLEIFYYQTGGDYWFDNTGWLDDMTHYCQWFGLTCNDDGLLTKIELKKTTSLELVRYT